MEKLKLAKRIGVRATLLKMLPGAEAVIKASDISPNTLRSAISVLNRKGYLFEATQKGVYGDGCKVWRIR
jgi:DNA-binding GntR family transcriptional regulator